MFAQRYNFHSFSIRDGLADAYVNSIIQSNDGFIFVGTGNGLSKFDGNIFTNFSKKDGLNSNIINTMLNYKKNRLLLGTTGGLSIFDGKDFHNVTREDGLKSDTIYTLIKFNNNYLVGTENGISIFNNDKIVSDSLFHSLEAHRVSAFALDKNNNLFIGTNKGLYQFENNKTTLINKNLIIYSLNIISNNRLLCGTQNGIYSFDGIKFTKLKYFENNRVFSITEDNKGQVWFGLDNGFAKLVNKKVTYFSSNESSIGRNVFSIVQDKEENIWIGTNHGIHLFDDGLFMLYDRRKGVKNSVWSIFENKNNEIWLGTDGGGLLKLKNGSFEKITYLKNLPSTIWNIFRDSKNNIWFATSDGPVKLSSNNKLTFFDNFDLSNKMIVNIFEDKKGNIWLTTYDSGIYELKNGKFIHYNLRNAKDSPIFKIIDNSIDKSYAIISSAGIDFIKNEKKVNFPLAEKLSKDSFYSIAVDSANNRLLLGTYNRGLLLYNYTNDSLTYISKNDGLNDDAIIFLIFDKSNSYLWIGTNHGLNRLDYQRFIKRGEVVLKSYNEYDGFPSYECNQLSPMIDSAGNLWYSSSNGVIKYDRSKEKNREYVSFPFISSVEINYKNIDLANFGDDNENALMKYDNIEFPYYMNNVTFYYSALYFTNPLDVKFKYRLIGVSNELSPFTQNKYVTFSSLPSGNYTFELISYTKDGLLASSPVRFSFYIQTPIWKSKFFYVFLFFVIIISGYLIYRIRTSAMRKKNAELLKLYKENISYQTQLIESEKDYKGLFENAHNTILITDPESYLIVDVNNKAQDLYGYKKDELINLSLKVLAVEPSSTIEFINKVVNKKTVRDYRITHLRKDGTEIILSLNASVTNYKGKVAIESVHRDITKEEETKRHLLLAKETAEKSNKLKTEFLAQISHEIRTPINTVLGYTSLLWEELRDNEDKEIVDLYDPIRRASERIIRTIDLVLNMSEISTGTFELFIKEFEISEILKFIVVDYSRKARNKGLTLEFVNKTDSAILKIDEYTFSQIFVNLIDNAIKYTNEGSINVVLFKTESETIIEVQDTGIGINEEYLPEIFDAFSQEQQGYTRKYEGNGLGLALVDNYVEINNGIISIESKKGVGSTFRVEFQNI